MLNLPFFTVAHVEREIERAKDDTDNRKWKLKVHSVYDGPLHSFTLVQIWHSRDILELHHQIPQTSTKTS